MPEYEDEDYDYDKTPYMEKTLSGKEVYRCPTCGCAFQSFWGADNCCRQ